MSTHIRVSADLLDHVLVEVSSIAHQGPRNGEGVLQAKESIVVEPKQRTLLELRSTALKVMDVLHPAVVRGSRLRVDVLLEHDDI